jgi:hypothetical protein
MPKGIRLALALALLCSVVGCPSTRGGPIEDDEVERCARVSSGTTTLIFRPGDAPAFTEAADGTPSPAARRVIEAFDALRPLVREVIRRDTLALELRVFRDPSYGGQLYEVTHARTIESPPPRRVSVECALRDGESPDAFIDHMRTKIVHEIAEATVVSNAPTLDPYLRWMHDGIAVLTEFLVESESSPQDAQKRLERYLAGVKEAKDPPRNIRWLDLTRWRQLSPWIVNFTLTNGQPLYLDLDVGLEQLTHERLERDDSKGILQYDQLSRMLGDVYRKGAMANSENEAAAVGPGWREDAILFYHASFTLWLEIERRHPGALVEFLDGVDRFKKGGGRVLTADIAIDMLSTIAGEDLRPRLLRYRFERLERVLRDEIDRLKRRELAHPHDGHRDG